MTRRPPDALHLWEIEEACGYFAGAGIPIPPGPFRVIIRELRKIEAGWGGTRLRPVGKTLPGPGGGQGRDLYYDVTLMDLHTALMPWLIPPGKLPAGTGWTGRRVRLLYLLRGVCPFPAGTLIVVRLVAW